MDQTFGLVFGGVVLAAMGVWWIILRVQRVRRDTAGSGGSDGGGTNITDSGVGDGGGGSD